MRTAAHFCPLGAVPLSIAYYAALRTGNHKIYTPFPLRAGNTRAVVVYWKVEYAIFRRLRPPDDEVTWMNILVIGCDQVGAALVRDLERIGHDISLVEKDPEQLKRLDGFDDYAFGGAALVGDPTDADVLKQGGIENCDAVAAVSEDDSVNLMAAQIAKNIFRREKVICRVSDPHLQILYHKYYGLETICPTILTEQAVFRALAK